MRLQLVTVGYTKLRSIVAVAYGTKITNFTNFTNITLVAAVALTYCNLPKYM